MTRVPAWLAVVAVDARTLSERLDAGDEAVWSAETAEDWLATVADGEFPLLRRRRAWSQGVGPGVGSVPSTVDGSAWLEVVAQIWETTIRGHQQGLQVDALDGIPFAPLVLPVLHVARQRLAARLEGAVSGGVDELAVGAMDDLESDLGERLLEVSGRVLDEELAATRSVGRVFILAVGGATSTSSVGYQSFVRHHGSTGWRLLFEAYPVMARLMGTTVLAWVDATAEFVERLAADRSELSRLGASPGATVTHLQPSVSDRHRGGRTVVLVTFSDGSRVVYKPKPLEAEALFHDVLVWISAKGLPLALRANPFLIRDGYGWCAFVAHDSCPDALAVQRYFVRAGILLALLHVMQATDAHYENIVAAGEDPVLIDCETILYPDPRPLIGTEADGDGAGARLDTVLRAGVLPMWQEVDGQGQDNSGLTGLDRDLTTASTWAWVAPGTDDMRLALEQTEPSPINHVILAGSRVSAHGYIDSIVEGFRCAHDVLRDHGHELFAPGGPLASAAGTPVRFIFRPTRTYGAVLASAVAPQRLRSGVLFGTHLDALASAFLRTKDRPNTWGVSAAETRALTRLDVPLFTVSAGSTSLVLDDGTVIKDIFTADSIASVAERIRSLTPAERDRQIALIRGAFAAHAARLPRESPSPRRRLTAPVEPSVLLEEAHRIGLAIVRSAVPHGAKGATWLGPRLLANIGRYQLGPLPPGLYDGNGGVAVFLAALANATGDRRFADLAQAAMQPTLTMIGKMDQEAARSYLRGRGLGMGSGLGGDVYALVSVARSLGPAASTMKDAAKILAQAVLAIPRSGPLTHDVLSGTAGALLGILALHESQPCEATREHARDLGHNLTAGRGRRPGTFWAQPEDAALTGFSHGAAGVAYALARLHAVAPELRFLRAAEAAVHYERATFDAVHRNWPDLRQAGARDPSGFCVKWCHGAAGIALGRCGALRYIPLANAIDDILVGARTTAGRLIQHEDFLCCGNAGRIDALLTTASFDPNGPWLVLAQQAAAALVTTARDSGYTVNGISQDENPGLFLGMAGIGYELLRVADPRTPSVLLMD